MNLEAALDQAREGRLYPGVILHGGDAPRRFEAALDLARTLLCDHEGPLRPCGSCRHCRRIADPEESERFHPDFVVLDRDLRTSTSVDAVKNMLRTAQVSPFEARGQVFVLRSAESLTGGAANALLKNLEEPALSAPRHFMLLTPSAADLLPTLRSRSLAIYLGHADEVDDADLEEIEQRVDALLSAYAARPAPILLLALGRALSETAPMNDPRDARAFSRAARLAVRASSRQDLPEGLRRALLGLAEELLLSVPLRLRGIQGLRIFEGLVAKHLGPAAARGFAPVAARS